MSDGTMTADDARAALAALRDTGACGAPTLRSALATVIALDAAEHARDAAEHDLDAAHEARMEVCSSSDATPDQIRAAEDAHTRAVIAATRARVTLAGMLGR